MRSASRATLLLDEFMRPDSAVTNDAAPFVAQARALVPSIRTAAKKLSAIASINRIVHVDTYNTAIAAAARCE